MFALMDRRQFLFLLAAVRLPQASAQEADRELTGRARFVVKVMRKGREADYRAFHREGKRTSATGEELDSASIGFLDVVDADNMEEAIALARARFPDHRIDEEGTWAFHDAVNAMG